MTANGGNGGGPDADEGSGGGGGGGLIHILAPSIEIGTTSVAAGSQGSTAGAGTVTETSRVSGGGGGGCAGMGGDGLSVAPNGSVADCGQSGVAGQVIQRSVENPAGLL